MESLFVLNNLSHEELLARMIEINACEMSMEFIRVKGYDLYDALYSKDCPPWWILWYLGMNADQPGYPAMGNLKLLLLDCASAVIPHYYNQYTTEVLTTTATILHFARFTFGLPAGVQPLRDNMLKVFATELEPMSGQLVAGVPYLVKYVLGIDQDVVYGWDTVIPTQRREVARLHDGLNALPVFTDDREGLTEAIWRDTIRQCVAIIGKRGTLASGGSDHEKQVPEKLEVNQPASPA